MFKRLNASYVNMKREIVTNPHLKIPCKPELDISLTLDHCSIYPVNLGEISMYRQQYCTLITVNINECLMQPDQLPPACNKAMCPSAKVKVIKYSVIKY